MDPLDELDSLQDVALAAQESGDVASLVAFPATSVSGTIEAMLFAEEMGSPPKPSTPWASRIYAARTAGKAVVEYKGDSGFLGLSIEPDELQRETFRIEAKKAGDRAGFDRVFEVVGAVGELLDNVYAHSEAPRSGIAAFNVIAGALELCVADAGIGALSTLRRATEFQNLQSDIDAVRLMIEPNVSRYGRSSGHGLGFVDLIRGLSKIQGHLRIRTGDAILVRSHCKGDVSIEVVQSAPLSGVIVNVFVQPPMLR